MNFNATTAGVIATLASSPSFANQVCAPRDTLLETLGARHGEQRQAIGLAGSEAMMELFASNDSGSWTIVMTRPDGISCMIAAGSAFEAVITAMPAGQPT